MAVLTVGGKVCNPGYSVSKLNPGTRKIGIFTASVRAKALPVVVAFGKVDPGLTKHTRTVVGNTKRLASVVEAVKPFYWK
jgi:hypothetical protein